MITIMLTIFAVFISLLLYPIVAVIFCLFLLLSVALWWWIAGNLSRMLKRITIKFYRLIEKIFSVVDWFKVKFFQSTSLGGWCLATVAVAFGLCTWDQFGGKKRLNKDHLDSP